MKLTNIPSEVIIYVILPYLQYKCNENSDLNIETLFGYFKLDYNRKIWLIWRGLSLENNDISELKECPLFTSLKILGIGLFNNKISKLKEYPLLTSLTLSYCAIKELKEYPLLTSLELEGVDISELKEYPLLTSLTLKYCKMI